MTFWKKRVPHVGIDTTDAENILVLKKNGRGPAYIVKELELPYSAVEGVYYGNTARFRHLYHDGARRDDG